MPSMNDTELLIKVLAEIDQRALDALLSGHGPDTAFGKALHAAMQHEDFQEMLRNRYSLEGADISKQPDTLRLLLYRLMERRQVNDPDIYNQCGIDKDLYHAIVSKRIKHHKNKATFYRMALYLRLDYYEAVYFMNLAGHPFVPTHSKADQVIAYCLCSQIYDFDCVEKILQSQGAGSLFDK